MAQKHEGLRGTSGLRRLCDARCTGGPLRARVSLKMVNFDGRAVGGAPGAIFIYSAITNTLYDCEKIPGRVFGRDQITCAELFCAVVCMGRPLRAHVLIEILRILMGERSVAHSELWALFDVPLRALFGYGVISGRVWA